LGFGKILWHKRFGNAQLGIFIKQAHVVFQETGYVSRGHVWCYRCSVVGSRFAFARVVSGPAIARTIIGSTFIIVAVCLFLATIPGAMSLDFTIEALIVGY